MNCQSVISNMGFSCRDIGQDTLRIWSPFTYGDDGERIGLYVEKTSQGYRITDNCESLMHASAMGISLTDNKVNALRKAVHFPACVSRGGEIAAFVAEEDISKGVALVLSAAMAVSHFESQWQPRVRSDSFTKTVGAILTAAFGDRVVRNIPVLGASGHQIELPLGIRYPSSMMYVQPISTDNENKVDWKSVYAGFGKMIDLKQAGADDASRVVVLEEAANESDMNKAISLLAEGAAVVAFSKLPAWARRKAA
ncbi:MAG: DUF1828 domain-containing protein [Bdellovibrionales bacterium]|nr:DUF1828 domain-containing protein [Ramlibacter sp.]